ncbi:MAG: HlyD family efflux transporter periplasmic adaptor subunit [Tenacibaculum sp.]|nr:HlyD family efflux transporter periplasmic adaptor subunit [Tenacibaculum sp.]
MSQKIIYISSLLFIIAIFILLPFINIPVTSSSRGTVRSITENTKINAVVSGRVVFCNLLKNNQKITKGDTLFVVISEQLVTQKTLQQNQLSDFKAQLNDLNKLTKNNYKGLQTGQYQKELSAMQEKIAQVKTQLSLSKKDYDRAKLLYEQGVIPKAEYDKFYYNYKGLTRQVTSIKEQQMAQWQTQKRQVERQLRSLNSEITKITQQQKNYVITAPISGRLVNFSGLQKNNFIIQGQSVGEISPEESLVVECFVSPKDIGFINLKQKVKFQVDTYNYNQWGLLEGSVKEINQNITVNKQTGEAFFRVLCTMDKDYLQLKNGYKGQIGKGMTLTTRFHLIDRTLWQLLFDRVDDWLNPKLISN